MNYIVLFSVISFCIANELDDSYYLQTYYGPKFHVDRQYPERVSYNEYCDFYKNYSFDNSTEDIEFPPNLWLALIHTVPSKISHIVNTRNTWCQEELQEKYGFRCIFILVESTVIKSGKMEELKQMNETYNDIYFIQMPDLKEQWFTLQQKNINSYILAMELFPDYFFYSRVDDQIMVTVDVLSALLMKFIDRTAIIGDIVAHRPTRNPKNKYYDPLALPIPRYFPFPAGYLSLFSSDIIQFIAQWDNYYKFAPSSLEDPGFGHWVYKFAVETSTKVDIVFPEQWGGNVKSMSGDYIVYHSQRGKLNQTEIFNQQRERGYMSV